MQEAMKENDDKEMRGHVLEKFCRYTAWHRIENSICGRGNESNMYNRACKAMTR